MKNPKIKVGSVVLRWNGVSNDKGVIFSIAKKNVVVLWKGVKEEIEKNILKWQHSYDYDKEEWTPWYWAVPALKIEETFVTKIEGDWIIKYNLAGKWVSMKLTPEAWKETFWFLRKPHELMNEHGYNISKEKAKQLQDFGNGRWLDTYYWVEAAIQDKSYCDELINWMIGPLTEIMIEREMQDLKYRSGLPFHAITFGLLIENVVNKTITSTMGKDVLRRMFDGENIETILKDDKYKISSDDDMFKFVKDVIEANPGQVEELKAGKEKILMWLVGQVMKASRGKANAAEVKEMLIKELNL